MEADSIMAEIGMKHLEELVSKVRTSGGKLAYLGRGGVLELERCKGYELCLKIITEETEDTKYPKKVISRERMVELAKMALSKRGFLETYREELINEVQQGKREGNG